MLRRLGRTVDDGDPINWLEAHHGPGPTEEEAP